MGSPAPTNKTPPWMSELVARNHKIVRNMWNSTESYFNVGDGDQPHNNASKSKTGGGNHKKQVVEPKSTAITSMNVTQPPQTGGRTTTTMAAVVLEQMHRTKTSKRRTEKSSPIRDEGGFMDDVNPKSKHYMRNGEEPESILEYGPGIVRKLRSRYQSLALRQYSTRPSLRRSASLENVLDMEMDASTAAAAAGIGSNIPTDDDDGDKRESPSPTPFEQQQNNKYYINKKTSSDNKVGDDKSNGDGVITTTMTKSKSATAVLEQQNQNHHSQMYEKKPPGSRGRAAVSERRDRMRRARSVDALQPHTRTKHEEEILEKCKYVVLPKEDIVIIEVSKPRANLNGLGELNNYLATGGDKTYPTQLFISPDRTTAGLTVSDNNGSGGGGGNRARSFISPEHELPPVDIVRETARIFEKNQENNKRVGHALRLSKSPSLSSQSENYSNPSSPTPPQQSQQQQQHKGLMTTNTMDQQGAGTHPAVNFSDDKTSTTTTFNNVSNNAKPASFKKQVGIIRPTVNLPTYSNNLTTNADKNVKIIESSSNNLLSPILSPTQTSYKTFLQQNSSKPPLSPKPLFTSSPKQPPPQSPFTNNKSPKESQPLAVTSQQPTTTLKVETVPNKKNAAVESRAKSPSFTPATINNKEKVIQNGEANNNINNNKGLRESSAAGTRQPLKHVPNSFTINSNIKDIQPASVPVPQKSSPSLSNGGVKVKATTTTSPTPLLTEEQQPKNAKTVSSTTTATATKTIVEPTKTVHSPQPQRRSNNNAPPPVAPPTPPRKVDVAESNSSSSSSSNASSQLRVHQKQKSKGQGGNSPMVFNFTTRSSVPDYIEDDGLHNGRLNLRGTVSDESVDDIDSTSDHHLDAKLIKVVGGNVIINGKSSIQKKPKSTKMNISFNEDGITTYEYPSETSLLGGEGDINEKDMLGHKGPSVVNNSGNGLGSYTPRLGNNSDYQLGNFDATSSPNKKPAEVVTKKENATELIEDYLKPDNEDTTWSNELTSDIMF